MIESHDSDETLDTSSNPADALDAGLAAGFGRPAEGPASVLSQLRTSLGTLRPVLLKEAEGDTALVVKPHSDALPTKEHTGDRYQLSGEIARGGMGAVLRARDVDLGRDLAVKVLLEKYVDRPEVARRFIEEAQIGGQLQHPGVVPVYDIGRFGDRPFFTMKLVKGQTLSALLSERGRVSAPSPPVPGERGRVSAPSPPGADATRLASDLPRFRAVALQVAQTLAYAHAKGVIHRDLKPANVMVGAFGEVQVMDWGLAKVLAEGVSPTRRRPAASISPSKAPGSARRGAPARWAASAPTRRPDRSWVRPPTWRRNKPTVISPTSTAGPMCSGWGPSCARSSRANRPIWGDPQRKCAARPATATWPTQ
jgi:serine/threonine protein kinase